MKQTINYCLKRKKINQNNKKEIKYKKLINKKYLSIKLKRRIFVIIGMKYHLRNMKIK